jgi:hypothetical protein
MLLIAEERQHSRSLQVVDAITSAALLLSDWPSRGSGPSRSDAGFAFISLFVIRLMGNARDGH